MSQFSFLVGRRIVTSGQREQTRLFIPSLFKKAFILVFNHYQKYMAIHCYSILPHYETNTKTKIVTVAYDSFVSARHFTSSVGSMVTGIIVKSAHDHSVLCGLAFLSIYRNLCVTLAVSSLGTNLSTSLLVSGVSCHHLVATATRSSWSCATSAGSSSRHVERLPCQVVRRVFIITCFKKVVGQTAIAVELGEARRFARFS